jgi:hypothetical protein
MKVLPTEYPDIIKGGFISGYNSTDNIINLRNPPSPALNDEGKEFLIISSLIHETAHWAQQMYLDAEEMKTVNSYYYKKLREYEDDLTGLAIEFHYTHILERHAENIEKQWREEYFVEKGE